ncbi:hypothetical protein AB204_20520 [Xenorhabdus khoisanae]|uniref:Uncharacterized protein n=1 Tax=Xenorhabdus khoisanae TaxID=880157 RepID=A0A0J5FLX2_9GAMM|nr:hypothetical protein AB204_20520 [Xenorhabdus khoisanae]
MILGSEVTVKEVGMLVAKAKDVTPAIIGFIQRGCLFVPNCDIKVHIIFFRRLIRFIILSIHI